MKEGTLGELNIKKGDKLEFVQPPVHDDGFIYPDRGDVVYASGYSVYGIPISNGFSRGVWRIIDRDNPSPVRQVTRKEIVPGVYGHIWISGVDSGIVKVGFRNNALKKMDSVGMSESELRAVIDTLTQIADALKDK